MPRSAGRPTANVLIALALIFIVSWTPLIAAPVPSSITIARAAATLGLDPGFLREPGTIVDNIFDTLVYRDQNMKLTPGLATSWRLLNPTTWQFVLRRDVKFHNGEPFDANAVKFTVDRVLDPSKHSPTISYINTVARVDVVDAYTVNVVTAQPDPLIPTRFSRYPTEIVPPNYVRQVGDAGFSAHPVGTGPYKFVRWVKDDLVELVANDAYWRGIPKVQRVVFRWVPNDVDRIAALQREEADIIEPVPVSWVSTVERSPRLHVERVPHGGLTIYFGLKSDAPPLNNVNVRRALAYAIDLNTIVKAILRGFASPSGTQVGPFDFGYDPKIRPYPYDPARARALLAEAGYPSGFEIDMQGTRRYLMGGEVSQAVAQEFAAVGVRAKLSLPDWTVYAQMVPVKKQAPIYMLGWGSTQTLDADAAIYPILHSGQPYSTVDLPELDRLLDDARHVMDASARLKLYAKIQQLVHDQVPLLTLYQEDSLYGLDSRVSWKPRPDARIPAADIQIR
jgi:peptide/nickel transport system substrate-binding protein